MLKLNSSGITKYRLSILKEQYYNIKSFSKSSKNDIAIPPSQDGLLNKVGSKEQSPKKERVATIKGWSEAEKELVKTGMEKFGKKNYQAIQEFVGTKSYVQLVNYMMSFSIAEQKLIEKQRLAEEEIKKEEERKLEELRVKQPLLVGKYDIFDFETKKESDKMLVSMPTVFQKNRGRIKIFYDQNMTKAQYFKPYIELLSEKSDVKILYYARIAKTPVHFIESDIELTSMFSFEKKQSQLYLFNFLSKYLGFKSLNDWLKIDNSIINKYLLDRVLQNYGGSLELCLLELYPNHPWIFPTFKRTKDLLVYIKTKRLKDSGYLNDEKIKLLSGETDLEDFIKTIPSNILKNIFPPVIYQTYSKNVFTKEMLLKRHLKYKYSEGKEEQQPTEEHQQQPDDPETVQQKLQEISRRNKVTKEQLLKGIYFESEEEKNKALKFSNNVYQVEVESNPFFKVSARLKDPFSKIKSFDPTINVLMFKALNTRLKTRPHYEDFIKKVTSRYNINSSKDWYNLKYDDWLRENTLPNSHREYLFSSLESQIPGIELRGFKDKHFVDCFFLSEARLKVREILWRIVREQFGEKATLEDWYNLVFKDFKQNDKDELKNISKFSSIRLDHYSAFAYPYYDWILTKFTHFDQNSRSPYSIENIFRDDTEMNNLEDFYTTNLEKVTSYFSNFSLYRVASKKFLQDNVYLFKFTQFRESEFKSSNPNTLYIHSERFYQHLVSTENLEHPLDFIHFYLNNRNNISASPTFMEYGLPLILKSYFGIEPIIKANDLSEGNIRELYKLFDKNIKEEKDVLKLSFSKLIK
ncbi:hypothetical protein DICPUDRAFT_152008 [Dictyostelium purpureum]|uniref:Myb-like domain-containing protein n=1 Tax=Dictyostelium purpureum TaxID=5786 RepID=F0ZK93_DICPU|nr:uncharacterized protein DICPUDRAFT_152008 [Dictyostelium purpureum]EGC35645.1 hypothetical protein DICPUDRAFT_152008 [Dictyostelium purpureum]|eukprot:XP_003287824.1 hypothetical protein DICPUDRAFT_152008 [Dictyostelium purpureum]